MREFLLLASTVCLSAQSQPNISWHQTNFSSGIGYSSFGPDPVAGGMLIPGKYSGGIGIFMTGVGEYCVQAGPAWCPGVGQAVMIEDTGSLVDTSPRDLPASYGGPNPNGLPNRPADRHLVGQMAVDTNRNIAYFGGGINRAQYSNAGGLTINGLAATQNNCCGNFAIDGSWDGALVYVTGSANCPTAATPCTISSVSSVSALTFVAPGPGAVAGNYTMYFADTFQHQANNIWNDMFYLGLNVDPTTDLFTRMLGPGGTGLQTPLTISGGSYYDQGTFAFDAYDDCLFDTEVHLWRFCPTIPVGGGTPIGVLNAAQIAAGATVADNWTLEDTGPTSIYAGFVFEDVTKLLYIFGGSTTGPLTMVAYNPGGVTRMAGQVAVPSHKFVRLCTAGCTDPTTETNSGVIQTEYSAIAVDTQRHSILYHRVANAGISAPSDWEFCITCGLTGTWTQLTTLHPGDGNTNGTQIKYHAATNSLVSSGQAGTWIGQLSGGTGPAPVTVSGSVTQ